MLSKNVDLFKILSIKFIEDIRDAKIDTRGNVELYGGNGSGNNRNTCKTNIQEEARQLRKILLNIIDETEGRM